MFRNYIYPHMITIQDLQYDIFQLDDMRVRIVISLLEKELGTLYFEKAKRAFTNKPVGMNSWACVDAKVEGLYVVGGEEITPKDIVAYCQQLLRTAGS
jgi:hemolysin-activating ACP:hemolysin acyltransferase